MENRRSFPQGKMKVIPIYPHGERIQSRIQGKTSGGFPESVYVIFCKFM